MVKENKHMKRVLLKLSGKKEKNEAWGSER